jgi:hypothetical protein
MVPGQGHVRTGRLKRSIARALALAALVVLLGGHPVTEASTAPTETTPWGSVVEIRSYNLKPGTRERFHQLFLKDALPMLRRWKVDVVGYGPSLHDQDSYYLMRAFPGVADRERSEDAFYGSEEWRQGPREAILACIESYTTIVIRMDEEALRGLRRAASPAAPSR